MINLLHGDRIPGGSNSQAASKQVLFEAQRENWFYAAGAMSWDHARGSSHDSQHNNCRNGNPWITEQQKKFPSSRQKLL
jgi:hypothetical protein